MATEETNGNGKHKSPRKSDVIQSLKGVKFKTREQEIDPSRPHHCNLCGKRYYRRDRFEGWAPSLIKGVPIMHAITVRICLVCAQGRTQSLLNTLGGVQRLKTE